MTQHTWPRVLDFRTAVGSFCLALFVLLSPQSGWPQGTLAIHHIDVGQGDSTLIVAPSGKTLLVDAGNNGMGTKKVVPLLRKLGITTIDFMVATHYDADHIGGLDEVILALANKVTTAFDRGKPDREDTSKTYKDYESTVEMVRGRRKTIAPGTALDLGTGLSVVCVAVNGRVQGGGVVTLGPKDENDASVALKLRFKGFDYFIGGDLTGGGKSGTKRTKDVESLVAAVVGDVDVLKVSHHGSQTSSNGAFLAALQPEVAVISVGNGGSNRSRYHHPTRVVVDRLLILPGLTAVFQTNRGETRGGLKANDLKLIRVADGDVVITTNGRSYSVNGTTFQVDERAPDR